MVFLLHSSPSASMIIAPSGRELKCGTGQLKWGIAQAIKLTHKIQIDASGGLWCLQGEEAFQAPCHELLWPNDTYSHQYPPPLPRRVSCVSSMKSRIAWHNDIRYEYTEWGIQNAVQHQHTTSQFLFNPEDLNMLLIFISPADQKLLPTSLSTK